MAEDWAADVKKYAPNADDAIIAGIVRYCGIALQKRDSSLVAFSDPKELARVRENFLKKKLGLTQSDATLDKAIAAVGEIMKADRTKNRVTVYYLLAEKYKKLQLFAKATKAAKAPAAAKKPTGAAKAAAASPAKAKPAPAKAAAAVAGAAGAVGAAALGAAGAAVKGAKAVGETAADAVGTVASGAVSGAKAVGDVAVDAVGAVASGAKAVSETAADAAGAAGAAVVGAAGAAAAMVGSAASAAGSGVSGAANALKGGLSDDKEEGDAGMGWLIRLALIAVVLGVLWWLFYGRPSASPESTVTTEQSAAASGTEAPAEGTVAIPTGAGVTTETRDGKPVVKVYFDTGKTDIVPAFGAAAGGLKAYLDGHTGSTLAVSGYNDKTGNAAANAALSKKRAQAVKAALVTSGIADASVALVKPAETTDTKVDDAAARRVEVVVQ